MAPPRLSAILALATLALLIHTSATAKTDGELLRAFQATFTNGAAVLGWPATGEPCNKDEPSSSWRGVRCMGDRVYDM